MTVERPVLATDWDDVCYEFARYYFQYYNGKYGTSFQTEDLLDHDLAKHMGRDIEHILTTVDDFHRNAESVGQGLIDSAKKVIPQLAEEFDIVVITSRLAKHRSVIDEMIAAYIPGTIREVYLSEVIDKYEGKGRLAKHLGVVALVDDHIENIKSAEIAGVRTLLRNMPKNYYHPLAVERVKDWYDIYQKLTGRPAKTQS